VILNLPYREIWAVDFEFTALSGERPVPLCMVARELRSGRLVRQWLADGAPERPPFKTRPDCLFVAYYASAELGCHLALSWPIPVRILDLFSEFRCMTNGLAVPCGNGILGALTYFGLPAIDAIEKSAMRDLAMRGGPYTETEQLALLDYCQTDVEALARLLPAMMPSLDLPRALLRGRYMAAAARIEWSGVPIDTGSLAPLRTHWHRIKARLIRAIDVDYKVYVPGGILADVPMRFSTERWEAYLEKNEIPWPLLPSGRLALDDDTFRMMARTNPTKIGPIRELRQTLGQLRLNDLAVGTDGRNRLLLSVFQSKTGRNQPGNSRFIFGPSTWLRGLIRPEPGRALAYVDWSGQEYGIAAALSGDVTMQFDYASGDPYLAFGKRIGAVPENATKKTHGLERDQLKTCCGLGAMYGAGPETVAQTLGVATIQAREWLRAHRELYKGYWRWSDSMVDGAMLTNQLHTVFGWTLHVCQNVNPRSIRNFPMQAHGAEMMRLACCLATEKGIHVCCPVHDALLVEGPVSEIESTVEATKDAMKVASELVLPGFPLRTDAKIVRYPDRYMDPRGEKMWNTVSRLLAEIKHEEGVIPAGYP
jgi:DNA polymerase I